MCCPALRPCVFHQHATVAAAAQEGAARMAVKPSPEDLERFEEVSPIAHVAAVTAPLLFMLGARDRRWAAAFLTQDRQDPIFPGLA